ncbi:MAG: RecQ family ATP-dependent DNA helicase, partial [Acidimicrobiia bacterium]
RALRSLRLLTANPDAEFRDGQQEAIDAVLGGSHRALVVQRTGWGKSAVYFIATRVLRDRGAGPTVIVSPLLALMRNQVEAASRLGLTARTVNSTNRATWENVFEEIDDDEVDLLLISPERLNNPSFRADILPKIISRMGLLVIDEVHCISDWGHDFRPDYRRLERIVAALPPSTPVLGTTATANDRVVEDIVTQLGDNLVTIRGTLDRPSLQLQVIDMPDKAQRLAWLAQTIPTLDGSGIVYTLTIADANRTAAFLRSRGIDAAGYTGQTESDARLRIEERLSDNDLKVVVATSALAMGYDNPFIQFVVHFQIPGSAISYYQQVGRSGRAVDSAYGIALAGAEDVRIQDYFIDSAFPPESVVNDILDALSEHGGLRLTELLTYVNIRQARLEATMNLLDVEGAVYNDDGAWYRAVQRWTYPTERFDHVTNQRRIEQAAMRRYVHADDCLMAELRTLLDDPAERCGRCANCLGSLLPEAVNPEMLRAAEVFLASESIVIEPRLRPPRGIDDLTLTSQKLEPGRALSRYNEGGLGELVRQGKYETHRFDDSLIDAAARFIQRWRPQPAPQWLTGVPDRAPNRVLETFAKQLAERLSLEYIQAVRRTADNPPQKTMENSFMQANNVLEAFSVRTVQSGPVLLVDDIIDSRWTMTVIGNLLLQQGSGPVIPFALSYAGNN